MALSNPLVPTLQAMKTPKYTIWQYLLVGLVSAALLAAPRLADLDHFVTSDEPYWLTLSANFYYALGQRDFAATFQREHPAVTTLWAGTAGFLWRFPEYRGTGTGMIVAEKHEQVFKDLGRDPLELLAAGRLFVVLGITAATTAALLYAMALWGWSTALVGAVLVGFNPLNLAMARIFHMDGLLASFMLLSVMAMLAYLYRGRRLLALLVSGLAAGLAWLSKSPGFFLIPFAGLLFAIDFANRWRAKPERSLIRQAFRTMLFPLLLWLICGGVIYMLLWPAMWVDPLGTLQRVLAQAGSYAAEGHGSANYFLGEIFYISQRPTSTYFFYPIAYLWRATPAALAGLALTIPAFWNYWKPLDEEYRRKPAISLALYALLFLLFMTLGAKLLDRYMLPAMPALDLLAACGWVGAATWLGRFVGRRASRWAGVALLAAVALVQSSGALRTHPYYFTYYNPLVGGVDTAPNVLMIGWGEGLDETGRYLSQKPGAEDLQVASWYGYGSFSYFFPGRTIAIPSLPDVPQDALDRFMSADYLVIYSHQWQRNTPASLLAAIRDWQPEHSIWLNGLEYARIYPTGKPTSP